MHKDNEDFRVRFLDVVSALQIRRALRTKDATAGRGIDDQQRIGLAARVFVAMRETTRELHGTARKIEENVAIPDAKFVIPGDIHTQGK